MIAASRIQELATQRFEQAVENRRHLHQNPELSFEEENTARYIASALEARGIEKIDRGVGGNGVVATITGAEEGPAIALRADIDALPIQEVPGRSYGSTNSGVMHACGHDGHTSSLLLCASVLHAVQEELPGTVKLMFQPAEERIPGGAQAMIRDGVLESPLVHAVLGQHVNPDLEVGTVGFCPGLFMASADDVYITIEGKGAHAAKPHLGIDPVAVASNIIVSLQQIVSRNANPIVPSVLTFGRFIADGATNVIPNTVEIEGTFRTIDPAWRDAALERIERAVKAQAEALGARATVRIDRGYPPLVNDEPLTSASRRRAVEYLGKEHVVDLPPAMWAEDFSYFGLERPACFYNLGVRNENRGIIHQVHTPEFDLDEQALRVGGGLMAWLAIGALEELDSSGLRNRSASS
ncbi:MAG: M20 family metallopeptidase [Spirochaetales bacterium]